MPQGVDELAAATFDADELLAMNSNHRYAALAALEAWPDAGLARPARGRRRRRLGHRRRPRHRHRRHGHDRRARGAAHRRGKVRRLGSTAVEQVMASGISARVVGPARRSATR